MNTKPHAHRIPRLGSVDAIWAPMLAAVVTPRCGGARPCRAWLDHALSRRTSRLPLAGAVARALHISAACRRRRRRREGLEDRDPATGSADLAIGSADPAAGSADPAGAVGRRPFLDPVGDARVSAGRERDWAWSCLSGCSLRKPQPANESWEVGRWRSWEVGEKTEHTGKGPGVFVPLGGRAAGGSGWRRKEREGR